MNILNNKPTVAVGDVVGTSDGSKEGNELGFADGDEVGFEEGHAVGDPDGMPEGALVSFADGREVIGALVGPTDCGPDVGATELDFIDSKLLDDFFGAVEGTLVGLPLAEGIQLGRAVDFELGEADCAIEGFEEAVGLIVGF